MIRMSSGHLPSEVFQANPTVRRLSWGITYPIWPGDASGAPTGRLETVVGKKDPVSPPAKCKKKDGWNVTKCKKVEAKIIRTIVLKLNNLPSQSKQNKMIRLTKYNWQQLLQHACLLCKSHVLCFQSRNQKGDVFHLHRWRPLANQILLKVAMCVFNVVLPFCQFSQLWRITWIQF